MPGTFPTNQLQTDGIYNYFYDGEGNLIRRESISGWAATLYESEKVSGTFVLDRYLCARGQLQLESQQHGLLGQSILFDRDYDAVGNQTLLEANIGGAIVGGAIVGGVFDFRNSFSYDRMDRLTSVTQTGRAGSHTVAPKYATFTYDAASQLTDWDAPIPAHRR